jgi:hypothetical protein
MAFKLIDLLSQIKKLAIVIMSPDLCLFVYGIHSINEPNKFVPFIRKEIIAIISYVHPFFLLANKA